VGGVEGAEDGDVVESVGVGFGQGGLWCWEGHGRAEGAGGGEEEDKRGKEGGHFDKVESGMWCMVYVVWC